MTQTFDIFILMILEALFILFSICSLSVLKIRPFLSFYIHTQVHFLNWVNNNFVDQKLPFIVLKFIFGSIFVIYVSSLRIPIFLCASKMLGCMELDLVSLKGSAMSSSIFWGLYRFGMAFGSLSASGQGYVPVLLHVLCKGTSTGPCLPWGWAWS